MKLYIFLDYNDLSILMFKEIGAIDYSHPYNYDINRVSFYKCRKYFEIGNEDRITYL